MPADQAHHDEADDDIEDVVEDRGEAFDEDGKEEQLQNVGDDRKRAGSANGARRWPVIPRYGDLIARAIVAGHPGS